MPPTFNILEKLQAPFAPEDIEWRAQSTGYDKNNNPWALIMPYVTNRAIQQRLDEVFGVFGWRNKFRPVPVEGGYNFLCGISAINAGGTPITKWDGAEESDIESFKGGISNSMKRAGVQWGIGRYLYKLSTQFAELTEDRNRAFNVIVKDKNGKRTRFYFNAPQLPDFALPKDYKGNGQKPAGDTPPKSEMEKSIEKNLGGKNLTDQANNCKTLQELSDWWKSLSSVEQKQSVKLKNERKNELSAKPKPSYTLEQLKAKSIVELKAICKKLEVTGYSKLDKGSLVATILKTING